MNSPSVCPAAEAGRNGLTLILLPYQSNIVVKEPPPSIFEMPVPFAEVPTEASDIPKGLPGVWTEEGCKASPVENRNHHPRKIARATATVMNVRMRRFLFIAVPGKLRSGCR